MSVSINNLFNYSRSLPVSFDTMTNKKVKVASMYGAKTESTLCGSVIKAVHAMCRCMNGTGEGAVGQIDTNKSVAEYKSSVGPDAYHLVVFDAASGSALASVYDKNTELIEQYVAHPSQRDGAAIFFALMPFLMSDAEFDETFQEYYDQFIAGYPDMAKATESMAILCDNAYRRIKDDTCPAHINITVDKSGNLMRVSQGQLDSGSFVPTSVTAGEFTIFAKTGPAVIKKAGVVVEHTDFVGKYPLTPGRTLSALELSLIPKLPEWYIIPPEVVDICKHAQKTTGRPMQMRNFLLRGPAGTGKTMGAKAIAAGLGLPYMKYTCSANTEIFDFTGMIFPETDAVSTGSPELDREREILKSMGGISYANVAKLMRLPDLDDMDYDPAGVYQALTGVENLAATVQDCMSVVLEKVTEKVQALSERALWEYVRLEPRNNEMLRYVAHHISNVIEDAYIENRILAQFRGTLGSCLEALREQQYESIPTVTELIEKEDDGNCHIFESILQIMLSYVKFGEIKYGDAPLSDERIQVVFKLIHDLDAAIVNPSGKERLKVVNLILVRCWDYIEDFLEICKKRQEEAKASGSTESLAETIAQLLQAMAGSSVSGEGSSTPIPEVGAVCVAAGAGKRAQTAARAEKSESEGSSGSEDAEPQTDSESERSSAGISQTENPAEEGTISGDMEGASGGKQAVSAEEDGRIPYQQTDRVSEGSGGATKHNDAYERERYDHAAEDIERLLDKMAEKAACEQLENERTRELNDVAQSISYGDVHAGVDICVNRMSTVDEELVEQYNAISGPLLDISRQLQKSLLQQLKDKQRGGKQTGLMMGRRLDAHALCRNDGKGFYKNASPNEIPQMSVGLLLDESGSMCSCDRCTYARSSAIILYDFCKALHIPVTVYGHSTSGSSVELYSYAEFESIDNDDKYRMMDIAARGSNRDGAALRFMAEQLVKRPEEVKILILASDGQPAAPGYYGSAAEEDLRGIKQEYRRKGVLFIAAAIGEDKQNIERIYGDSFMDITDLNQLPVKLTAAVKRHTRV